MDESKTYFEQAANIQERENSIFGIRSTYMLSRVNYKQNLLNEARRWYQQSFSWADAEDEFEYKAKLQMIYSLYDRHDPAKIDEALGQLREKKLWSDVAELTTIIALHYKKEGNICHSEKYFEQACHAKDQILKLTRRYYHEAYEIYYCNCSFRRSSRFRSLQYDIKLN